MHEAEEDEVVLVVADVGVEQFHEGGFLDAVPQQQPGVGLIEFFAGGHRHHAKHGGANALLVPPYDVVSVPLCDVLL